MNETEGLIKLVGDAKTDCCSACTSSRRKPSR